MATETLDSIETQALSELALVQDVASLDVWRAAFLGPKGRIKQALAGVKDVAPELRPAFGQRANQVNRALQEAFAHRKITFGEGGGAGKRSSETLDMTEPGVVEMHNLGKRHVTNRVRDELVDVFARMGFTVAQGPELEDDEHNFAKLNIPADHPARDPIDNFYVDDPTKRASPRMLRSQTSTVQIRTMERAVREGWGPPIKIISPGRVYRPDTVDATHSFMFHQIEGLYIDRDVSMADLKSTLLYFARAYFGDSAEVRLRPSYFPFTEVSAEFDMKIALRPGDPPRWIELGGCGMVDPLVLRSCDIDPEQWTGFAFGFGIDRIAMGKYNIPDIRMLFENDLRFLDQI